MLYYMLYYAFKLRVFYLMLTHLNHTKKYALLSVSDKTGIVDFAKGLLELGYTLLSTGGTASLLKQQAIAVTDVADYTGFPEILDGRVKTLNPKIHGGILAKRQPEHLQTLDAHQIGLIDIVCVNLYPFNETIAKANTSLDEAIENIDIGGPTMVRAAAKNHQDVLILVDGEDYQSALILLNEKNEHQLKHFRLNCAKKAFAHTAAYDASISNYLHSLDVDAQIQLNYSQEPSKKTYPDILSMQWHKQEDLRYGENPHQSASFYKQTHSINSDLASYTQLQGKALSYNNLADSDACWQCVKSFDVPSCVIVKHANPCGVAMADNALNAYTKAFKTDSTSAFGGIIGFNCLVDAQAALALMNQFIEVLIAPEFTPEALAIFAQKPNIRILQIALSKQLSNNFEIKQLEGGILYQQRDLVLFNESNLKVVTEKQPTLEQMNDLLFAFKVAQFVKSNAIIFCKDGMTLGVGAGQMSRLDSARIASIKAEHAGLNLQNSAVASDAFFPFTDGLDVVADQGASCIIQPGGSIKDDQVIARANERGLVMVFTGMRHFKH